MRKFGPRPTSDDPRNDKPCPACHEQFTAGDYTTLILLGPGPDPDARAACRRGRSYNAVALEVHWACATGEED